MEINIHNNLTSAFSGLPVVEAVYLDGTPVNAYYGDFDGNVRDDCVICYCKIPDGRHKLTTKANGFKAVSLKFEVSKRTRFDLEEEW